MTVAVFTGACTINGIRYSRDQLTRMCSNGADISVYDDVTFGARVYADAKAVEKNTAKVRRARQKGYLLNYTQFFEDWEVNVTDRAFNYADSNAQKLNQWRILRLDGFRWLHEVSPGADFPRAYPLTQVSAWARERQLMVMVRARSSIDMLVETMIMRRGEVIFVIRDWCTRFMDRSLNQIIDEGSTPYRPISVSPDFHGVLGATPYMFENRDLTRYEVIYEYVQRRGAVNLYDPSHADRLNYGSDMSPPPSATMPDIQFDPDQIATLAPPARAAQAAHDASRPVGGKPIALVVAKRKIRLDF